MFTIRSLRQATTCNYKKPPQALLQQKNCRIIHKRKLREEYNSAYSQDLASSDHYQFLKLKSRSKAKGCCHGCFEELENYFLEYNVSKQNVINCERKLRDNSRFFICLLGSLKCSFKFRKTSSGLGLKPVWKTGNLRFQYNSWKYYSQFVFCLQ